MFLLDWIQQFYAMRYEAHYRKIQLQQQAIIPEEPEVCKSCEVLKQQLEIANFEKKQLLTRLLDKPEVERTTAPPLVAVPPNLRNVPWRVRQQMLEAEDRAKAKAMRDAPKPDAETEKKETEAFERELKEVTERREQQVTGESHAS